MSSNTPTDNIIRRKGEDREQRLAHLSGAMALARLSHQVKELELQKHQSEILTEPSFVHPACVVLTSSSSMLMKEIAES